MYFNVCSSDPMFVCILMCCGGDVQKLAGRRYAVSILRPPRGNENIIERIKVCDWCGCICHHTRSNRICRCLHRLSGHAGNESHTLTGGTDFHSHAYIHEILTGGYGK